MQAGIDASKAIIAIRAGLRGDGMPVTNAKKDTMSRLRLILIAGFAVVLVFPFEAAKTAVAALPAFPEARGGGAASVGGRGGQIIEVTNLNDAGSGSFRACVESSGPRICVFRVAGIITISSRINISSPYLTVAGQSAPGSGIELNGSQMSADMMMVSTHDVILRYFRIRVGVGPNHSPGPSTGIAGIWIGNGDASNVILDHMSFSWSDNKPVEPYDNSGATRDITVQWTMVNESLLGHAVCIMSGGAGGIATANQWVNQDYHHNLISNCSHRNPLLKNKSTHFVNNLVYNWSFYASQSNGATDIDYINNKYKAGPMWQGLSIHEIQATEVDSGDAPVGSPTIFLSGNIGPNQPDPNGNQWLLGARVTGENGSETGPMPVNFQRFSPLPAEQFPITADPAASLDSIVLPSVGSSRRLDCNGNWVNNRDAVDARLVNEYSTGTGKLTSNENDVGGWSTIIVDPGQVCADADHDGMPDVWETAHGLNPNDPTDGNVTAANGYTNVENYLNGSGGQATPTPSPSSSVTKFLILHDHADFAGGPVPDPTYVRNNKAFLETQPFDGIAMRDALSGQVMRNTAISAATLSSDLSPISNLTFTNLTHNFYMVFSDRPADPFDDWSVAIQNFANLAKAVKDAGLKGIFFDNEEYNGHWTNYPDDAAYASTKTLQEYRDQVRLRGRQIMEAMVAQFPDITVVTFHGPYSSDPNANWPTFNNVWFANELKGPFFAGFVEGMGSQAKVVDGGELYGLRSSGEFQAAYDWRKFTIASDANNNPYIPPSLRALWPAKIGVDFGLYDLTDPASGRGMDPSIMQTTVTNSLKRSDDYVWLYTEAQSFLKPPSQGGASQAWVDAVRQGRAVAINTSSPTPTPSPTASPSPSQSSGPTASPTACTDPAFPTWPSADWSRPCPVFNASPATVARASGTLNISVTPPSTNTVMVYKTLYIFDPSWNCPGKFVTTQGNWCPLTLSGTAVQGSTDYLSGISTATLSSTLLANLTIGTHYLAQWDWTWDSTNHCYKGPGSGACYVQSNPSSAGHYRLQSVGME